MKQIVDTSVVLTKFVKMYSIGGIKKNLLKSGKIKWLSAKIYPHTRMYLVSMALKTVMDQPEFFAALKLTSSTGSITIVAQPKFVKPSTEF